MILMCHPILLNGLIRHICNSLNHIILAIVHNQLTMNS